MDVGLDGDLAIYDQQNGTKRLFKVDRIFDKSCSQAAVYEDTQPLIRSVLDGELNCTCYLQSYNCTLYMIRQL